MKKIYFAQINNVIAEAIFLPLSSAFVWEYCRSQSDISEAWELGNIFFKRQTVEEYLEQISNPDIFAFSTYVWNWDITQKLAKAVRKKYPNCLIVFGGPQVPYKREWLTENRDICDLIVTYAGEKPFVEILRGNYSYPGVMSEHGYKTPAPDKEIDYIPSPYLSGLMDSLMEPGTNYSAIIETNRGCPYACTFCDQEALYYNKIQLFDYSRVLKEIDWMSEHKIDFLYFADSNVGIFDRDVDFIRYIAKKRNETGYPKHIDYSTAKQQPERIVELGRILNQEANIKRGVTIALQSMNKKTLEAIKRINIANTKLAQVVSAYNSAGIDNYCELIIGLPEESLESWINGIGEILGLGSDHALTVHPLSIVPNTPFMDPSYIERYGLKYTPTPAPAGGNTYPEDSQGEIDFVCYGSNTMTSEDWINAYFFAKGIIIPHHYHGVSQVIATYLQREHGIPLIEYYKLLFDHSINSKSFLNKEYKEHTASVTRSLFEMETWGRTIPGGDHFHFQDNGATAAVLYMNIDEVHREIIDLVLNKYNIDVSDVAMYNRHILDIFNKTEMTQSFEHNWNSWFFDNKELLNIPTCVEVEKKSYKSISDHAKHIFWFGRKSKRCFLKQLKRKFKMIRVSDQIPNVCTMHKHGSKTTWETTHAIFQNKKVLILGIPGTFLVEYAASQIRTYDFYFDKFIKLGLDEIYFTSTDDAYVQLAWMKHEGITRIKNLPDPAGVWAQQVGMLEDMSREGLGDKRSHRYAMTLDNLICKNVKYEDFSHNPMTCFQVTDADTMLKYFETIKTNYERWNDNARDKVDNLGRDKINSVLS